MIILGLDPGITTGYALIEVTSPRDFRKIQAGTAKGYDGIRKLLELEFDHVVIENFTLWPKLAVKVSHDDPSLLTTRYIGACESFLKYDKVTPYSFQQPAHKKACPDILLTKYGLLTTNQSKHERDAMRHVVVFARRKYADDERKRKKANSVRTVANWSGNGTAGGGSSSKSVSRASKSTR